MIRVIIEHQVPGSKLSKESTFSRCNSGLGPRLSIAAFAAEAKRAVAADGAGVPARESGRLRVPCREPGREGMEFGRVVILRAGKARPFD